MHESHEHIVYLYKNTMNKHFNATYAWEVFVEMKFILHVNIINVIFLLLQEDKNNNLLIWTFLLTTHL